MKPEDVTTPQQRRERAGHKKRPERKCIVTGEPGTPQTLVRFAVSPDGTVVPDIDGKLPGRGIWVSASRQAVDKAAQKGLFARAAKAKVKAAETLADQVEAGLKARILALLGLAKKAGQLYAGLTKVEEAVEQTTARTHVAALFLASDAGNEGQRNGRSLAAKVEAPVIAVFSAEQLGLALGRANVVHAALTAGGPPPKGGVPDRLPSDAPDTVKGPRARTDDRLADLILGEVGRLQGFLGGA
ncbi:RNA-binding protein [Pyruvatibacter sp.]|uniref:RNA-binding protein n=1 Tax=Pyruvatibacter sp. TaxID=1981328 RepID=UPI0032EEDD36